MKDLPVGRYYISQLLKATSIWVSPESVFINVSEMGVMSGIFSITL